MKHDVLSFIDSDTLREMLRGKKLAPAVECILIAQSRKQPLTKKLEALTERADAYSDAEFQTGVYNLRDCDDFAGALRNYIAVLKKALQETRSVQQGYVFQAGMEYAAYEAVFTSFSDAAVYLSRENALENEESYEIIRHKINDPSESPVIYTLNKDYELVSVSYYDDDDWEIARAFVQLPHSYQPGEIISCEDEYYVIAKVSHADYQTQWLKEANSHDMSLYCLAYYPKKFHSCGGAFRQCHVPILQAERVNPNDLPYDLRPLKGFHMLLKREMHITDFIETYSNDSLDDLVCYWKKHKSD